MEVRATNAEGTSDWSNPGIGATNAPGANNPPVFTEGASATRSVSATASAGTSIGQPVTATDADSGDTLTYSLEGRDAALFDINTSTGQLLTKSGVTLIVGETYTVIVAADDQTEIARITVSIDATAAPPNNPPVFSEGASATRSVPAGAPAGTSIGLPVAATDADQGDTPTYSLEGQDAASFNITPSKRPTSHDIRRHADRRGDIHGHGCRQRHEDQGRDYGDHHGHHGLSPTTASVSPQRARVPPRSVD